MAEICKNCAQIISENFCANCGQKKFKRINRKYIVDEIQYTVLHTNKGLFYTLKNLIKNPGRTAREYIDGNRIHHYKPLLLVFVLSGISAFISFKILHFEKIMNDFLTSSNLNNNMMDGYMTAMQSYSSFFMLALVPIFALITKIAFRKWGNNYYEHLVMNCYILSLYTIITIVLMYPLIYFLKDSPSLIFNILTYQYILVPFVLLWFFKTFYNEKPFKSIFSKILLVVLLTFCAYVFFSLLIGLLVLVYTLVLHGPEGLNNLVKPK